MNLNLALPRDVTVTTDESEVVNAYYSEKTHSITVNYGLFLYVVKQTRAARPKGEKAVADAELRGTGLLVFALYHELGHCLIRELDLPVLGREEDDADQLATVILTKGGDPTVEKALVGAALYFAQDDDPHTPSSQIAWADEHSLGQQRFCNILSWLYGSDPKRLRYLVDSSCATRAACGVQEYKWIVTVWVGYLKPYRKR